MRNERRKKERKKGRVKQICFGVNMSFGEEKQE